MENQATNDDVNTLLTLLNEPSLLDVSIMHVQQKSKSSKLNETNVIPFRKEDNSDIDFVAVLSSN
jgi:hypothetical protein